MLFLIFLDALFKFFSAIKILLGAVILLEFAVCQSTVVVELRVMGFPANGQIEVLNGFLVLLENTVSKASVETSLSVTRV